MQTRYDFTICYGVLLILTVDLIMFGFFCTFYYSYVAEVAYGCLGALLYSLVRGEKNNIYVKIILSKGIHKQDLNNTFRAIK